MPGSRHVKSPIADRVRSRHGDRLRARPPRDLPIQQTKAQRGALYRSVTRSTSLVAMRRLPRFHGRPQRIGDGRMDPTSVSWRFSITATSARPMAARAVERAAIWLRCRWPDCASAHALPGRKLSQLEQR